MSGFRTPEQPRGQSVLWAQRLEDAIPQDHPVRLLDYLLHSEALDETFTAWAGEYVGTKIEADAGSMAIPRPVPRASTQPSAAKTPPRGGC